MDDQTGHENQEIGADSLVQIWPKTRVLWAHEGIWSFHGNSETHSCLCYGRFIISKGGEKMRPRLLNNEKRRRRRIRTLWCSGKMNLTHEVLKITRYRHPNYIIWAISILKLCKHQKYPCGAILLGWESESVGFGLTVWDGIFWLRSGRGGMTLKVAICARWWNFERIP